MTRKLIIVIDKPATPERSPRHQARIERLAAELNASPEAQKALAAIAGVAWHEPTTDDTTPDTDS